MKTYKIFLFVTLYFVLPNQQYAQWITQYSGTLYNLRSISFVDSLKGWIVGDSGIILHTNNGGLNWEKQLSSTIFNLKSVSFCDSLNGWVAGYGGMILRTTDGGDNWLRVLHDTSSITTNEKVKCLSPSDVIIMRSQFYGDYDGGYTLWKSTNAGETWTIITTQNTLVIRDFCFTSIQKGWIADIEFNLTSRFQKTTDGGDNWISQSTFSSPTKIYFENDSVGWITDGRSLFNTSDSGNLWSKKSSVQLGGIKDFIIKGDVGYSIVYESLYKTGDSGYTWTKQSLTSPNLFLDIEFVTKNIGWIVSTYGFIATTKNGGVTLNANIDNMNLNKFMLDQNYPNPFNPTTQIDYQIPQTGFVSLHVYDLLGREVTELVNEKKEAGRYSLQWNASQYASGIYYVKCQFGNYILSRKIILIK